MQAPPSTGKTSKDILLIKCLELGVVIGIAMAYCSVAEGTLWSQCLQYSRVTFPLDNEFSALKGNERSLLDQF